MRLRDARDGCVLDDGRLADAHHCPHTRICVPVTRHTLDNGRNRTVPTRNNHDVPWWPYRGCGCRAFELAQENCAVRHPQSG